MDIVQFDLTDISLYHNFDIITLSVAHFSEHKNFALRLRLISVGYTIGCGGGGVGGFWR